MVARQHRREAAEVKAVRQLAYGHIEAEALASDERRLLAHLQQCTILGPGCGSNGAGSSDSGESVLAHPVASMVCDNE
jgi:hypothetical protein